MSTTAISLKNHIKTKHEKKILDESNSDGLWIVTAQLAMFHIR